MNKRAVFLIFTALALAAAYGYFFTDLAEPKKIQIMYRNVPRRNGAANRLTHSFYLGQQYPVTSIKVISEEEAKTNKFPRPLWHVIAETNSAPIEEFTYGGNVPGMKPNIPGKVPDPLQPNSEYRVVVNCGKKHQGELTFHTR